MKAQKIIPITILPFLLMACSEGFHSLSSSKTSSSIDSVVSDDSSSVVYENSSDTIITGRGELKTTKRVLADKTTEIDFEMGIPFGRVYSTLSSVIRKTSPYICKLSSDIKSSGPMAYPAGEIPCGVPYSEGWKKLTDIVIDDYESDGSVKTKIYGFTLPVLLSTTQFQGYYLENRLDNKKNDYYLSSLALGEDISIRYVPNGQESRTELCMNIPGAAVRAPEVGVKARLKKKVAGVKISHTSIFDVDPGQARYSFGRGCFALDLAWVQGQGLTTKFSATQAPRLVNAKYEGFNIEINSWLLKFVDKVMSFFKKSIREKIVKQVRSTVNKIVEGDIETGAWYTKVHGEEMLEKGGESFNRKAREVIARIGTPSNKAEFKELLSDNCRLLKFGSKTWNKRLEAFCSDVVDKIDFQVEPFMADQKSKELGCYSGFANIHTTKINGTSQWWSKQCKFASKITVKINSNYADYIKELRQVLESHISQKQIPEEWIGELENLKIDAFKLSLILKALEARGINQITSQDWKTLIPEVLSELQEI